MARMLLLNRSEMAQFTRAKLSGGVVEWLMAPVLKTGRAQALVGSNPTPSAVNCGGLIAEFGVGYVRQLIGPLKAASQSGIRNKLRSAPLIRKVATEEQTQRTNT